MYFAAALASSLLSGERRILVQSHNGRQARGERGAFRRLIMDRLIHLWPSCAGLHAAPVSLLLLVAVAFFPLREARRYPRIVAWRDQSSPRCPCLQHEAPVFFHSSARSVIRTSDRMPAWPCRGGMDLYLYVDRSSANGHVPYSDGYALPALICLLLSALPHINIIICQGWYKCIVFCIPNSTLSFPSVRDKGPLPLLQAHLSIHCGHEYTTRYWRALFGSGRERFCMALARRTIHS